MSDLVFVVDDEARVRSGLTRMLRSSGYDVEAFGSAEAFLDRVGAASEGCVLLDLALPGLDGLAVQEELVRRGCDLPVIFLTGRGDVPASVRAMKGGAADFLTKPASGEILRGAIRAAIERWSRVRADRGLRRETTRRLAELSPREREVLDGVAGRPLEQADREPARDLGEDGQDASRPRDEKDGRAIRRRARAPTGARSAARLNRLSGRTGEPLERWDQGPTCPATRDSRGSRDPAAGPFRARRVARQRRGVRNERNLD